VLGDCGSWVINAQNGDIFGHIVAGDITSGLAYIIPAHKVFDDIEMRCGSRPVLPRQTVTDELRASELTRELNDNLASTEIYEGPYQLRQHSKQASTELAQRSDEMYGIASHHTKRSSSSSGHSRALKQPIQAPPPPSLSFIVKIQDIRPNYTVQPNRSTESTDGFFLPPDRKEAFDKGNATYFRWQHGRMSTFSDVSDLTPYSAATIFSQKDDTDRLLAVHFDALTRDVASYHSGWRDLSFDHLPKQDTSATYSFINLIGGEKRLAAGGSSAWIGQLLPSEYDYHRTTPDGYLMHSLTASAGLIGSLPILIGLAAFSAPKESLTAVLTSSIKPKAWRRHNLPTGRTPERGMVVTIYYDPMNPKFSNKDILDRLQNGEWGPFYA